MNTITEILRGLVGQFVDDELLAIGVLGVVGLSAVLIFPGAEPLAAGIVMLLGSTLVLVLGAIRTARRRA